MSDTPVSIQGTPEAVVDTANSDGNTDSHTDDANDTSNARATGLVNAAVMSDTDIQAEAVAIKTERKARKSSGSNATSSSKIGRRGDPRMHKAVAERLKDPQLSLAEALRRGGFEYPTHDDPTFVDAENVTLGQRKNQLSRRLRLSKKRVNSQREGYNSEEGSVMASDNEPKSKKRKTKNNVTNSKKGVTQCTSLNSHSIDPAVDETLSSASESDEGHRNSSGNAIKAKQHPQYQPIIMPTRPPATIDVDSVMPSQQSAVTPNQLQAVKPPYIENVTNNPPNNNAMYNELMYQHAAAAQSIPNPYFMNLGMSLPFGMSGAMLTQSNAAPGQLSLPSASGVAVASLTNTAQSVGMTLEQLALTLHDKHNLSKLLSTNSHDVRDKKQLALDLFQSENRALHQKCMLLAGYTTAEALEGSPQYVDFVQSAYSIASQRIQEIVRSNSQNNDRSDGDERKHHLEVAATALHGREHGEHDHRHDHGTRTRDRAYGSQKEKPCALNGRHVHRLEGKCGHKAILHQPPDGDAHIDFLVGDKVECYKGSHPVYTGKEKDAWPSQYNCKDIRCEKNCGKNHSQTCGDESCDCNSVKLPLTIDMQDITFGGTEWRDVVNDESVLGLFKLGHSNESEDGEANNNNNNNNNSSNNNSNNNNNDSSGNTNQGKNNKQ